MPFSEGFTKLGVANVMLMLVGGIVLLAATISWIRAGGRDPLCGSPLRSNVLSAARLWLAAMAYVFAGFLGSGIAALYKGPAPNPDTLEEWRGILASNLMQIIVTAAMLAIAARTFAASLIGFGLGRRPIRRDLRDAVAAWLVSICLCTLTVYVVERIVFWFVPGYEMPAHNVITALNQASTPLFIRIVAVAGAFILAPIGEECFFRGIIQTGLHRITPPKSGSLRHRWVAIAVTAVIFGLMHSQTPQYVPALVLFGAILGYVYERTGSLTATILVHMLFNGKTLLWYFLEG